MGENKFRNGKIYQIVDVGYNKYYIGSTCESLSRRMAKHRDKYKQYLNNNKDNDRRINYIFDEYGVENCKIELIENYPCENRDELLKREGHHIKNNECVNKIISGRTTKEWIEDNREQYEKKKKQYYEENKEYLNAQKQIYRELNPEIIKRNSKEYYETNKDKINQQILCLCGKKFTYGHKRRHEKSQKHQNYLKSLNSE